jgi:hypothetical protein
MDAESMKDNRLGAIALLIGALGGIIVLTFHPGGGHRVTPAQLDSLILLIVGVHALAIATMPFSFAGALALAREFPSRARLGILALIVYGLGLIAMMSAATMSGLVTPGIFRHMVPNDAASEQWQILLSYTHSLNQGFAQIGTVSASVAILLWSIVLLSAQPFRLFIGVFGSLLGLVILGALFSGTLNLELHGFRLITLGQAIWFMLAARLLWHADKTPNLQPTHI